MGAWFRSAKFDTVVFDTAWPSTRAPDRPFGRIGSRLDAGTTHSVFAIENHS
jgi:hypothetical protein